MTTTSFNNIAGVSPTQAQTVTGLVVQNTGVYLASWSFTALDNYKTYQLIKVGPSPASPTNPIVVPNTNVYAKDQGMLTGMAVILLNANDVIGVQNFSGPGSGGDTTQGNLIDATTAMSGFLTLVQIG
ncbi:hypothetical protein [Bacillus thuringiensis]|uniref:hypothetical protein n=1 Tax=Bacillus thuringiensis TaxID=1428 RepID=UPI001E3C7F1C|nr:hypothetical protein [Bacillus thuringiensis]MCU5031436.1 hypothetical protein [Bacillus cereus]